MEPVSLHRDGRIGIVRIDNPPVNALSVAVPAGSVGPGRIARRLEEFAASTGDERLKPAELPVRLAAEERGFASLGAGR